MFHDDMVSDFCVTLCVDTRNQTPKHLNQIAKLYHLGEGRARLLGECP